MKTPWCMTPPRGCVARERSSREDGLGKKRRYDPVGRVDDLADLEVDRDAAEDVGLLAAEPPLLDEMLDHVADRLLSAGEEIRAVCRGHVAGAPLERGHERSAGPEARLAKAPPRLEAEAERDARHHLDRRDAHLTVALRRVRVADAEERAVDPHGQEQRRARHQLLDVHVAAVLPRGNRAVSA